MRDALTAGPQHAAKAVPPTVAAAAANVAKSVGVTSYSSAVITCVDAIAAAADAELPSDPVIMTRVTVTNP